MSYPYVVFAGYKQNYLEPQVAALDEETAIAEAKKLEDKYACVEAVYMPEDDLDVNEIVYSYYKED